MLVILPESRARRAARQWMVVMDVGALVSFTMPPPSTTFSTMCSA
jgi:hypothetical protein